MATFLDTVARHIRTLRQFTRRRDRALYVYGRILRRTSWPLPGRHTVVRVHLRGQGAPFFLRLGSTDWLVIEEIFQRDEYSFVRGAIKGAAWIVDLGANAGYSLRYWQTIFPAARIIAIEPEPDNCSLCMKNIVSAGLEQQTTLLQAAIGARGRQTRLVDVGEGEWAYRTNGTGTEWGQPVEVLPLAEVLARHAPGKKIDLLKCDIEGAEQELFKDCRSWIGQIHAIAIELHPPYSLPELLAALKQAGADFVVSAQINRKLYPVVLLHQSPALA